MHHFLLNVRVQAALHFDYFLSFHGGPCATHSSGGTIVP